MEETHGGDDDSGTTPAASLLSLLVVLEEKQDAFQIIAAYLGNPFDFRRLGQTCKALKEYFSTDKDDVWKLSATYSQDGQKALKEEFRLDKEGLWKLRLPFRDPSGEQRKKLKWGDYLEDDRLPTMWEKAMVKAVQGKVYLEQRKDENILESVVHGTDIEWLPMYTVRRQEECFNEMDRIGKLVYEAYWFSTYMLSRGELFVRPDTGFAMVALVEGNVMEYIGRANLLACDRGKASGTFPCITREDFNRVRQVSGTQIFGGGHYFNIAEMNDRWITQHPFKDVISRRLARRAGAIQITDAAMKYIWKMVAWLIRTFLYVMDEMEQFDRNPKCLQHPANMHMKMYPPKPCARWMPTPGMVITAAKTLGLPVTTFYDTKERINMDFMFEFYYNKLSPKEKQEYELSTNFTYDPCKDADFKEWDFSEDEDDYNDDEAMIGLVPDEESDGTFSADSMDDFEDDDVSMGEGDL
ncbi:MAG: hypothetical protein SGILL_008491 [Bacillariaceae sp.]